MSDNRLAFELDHEIGLGAVTAHAGVPALIEHFRRSGAAAAVDAAAVYKRRKRGLSPSEMAESLVALWAAGGEPAEDLDHLRQGDGLGLMLGHGLPAAQTARDFLASFDEPDLPLLGRAASAVRVESQSLRGLARASAAVVADLQRRRPASSATIDLDATFVVSSKRAAREAYDRRRGYHPVIALWAEQDMILADEFRDGNVRAQIGNQRVIEAALAALPSSVEKVYLRADSALYEHKLMVSLDLKKIGFAISVRMSASLREQMERLGEAAWCLEQEDGAAMRHWAELDFQPDRALAQKEGRVRHLRYVAVRVTGKQGVLFSGGAAVKYFAVVTNRVDLDGAELLHWHRGKAGTVEHAHDVVMNELAGRALPSQKFGANAAWFRLNVILYNLLSAFKRLALPAEFHRVRPKRLRFLVLNTLARLICHARERLLRCASAFARAALDRFRVRIHGPPPKPV